MPEPTPELADIFRQFGPAYRQTHSLPLHQHRLMQAIEACRTPLLGGTVEWCDDCQFTHTRYRSCRNRHCPTSGEEAWSVLSRISRTVVLRRWSVSGHRPRTVAGRSPCRTVAHRLLPRCFHAADQGRSTKADLILDKIDLASPPLHRRSPPWLSTTKKSSAESFSTPRPKPCSTSRRNVWEWNSVSSASSIAGVRTSTSTPTSTASFPAAVSPRTMSAGSPPNLSFSCPSKSSPPASAS